MDVQDTLENAARRVAGLDDQHEIQSARIEGDHIVVVMVRKVLLSRTEHSGKPLHRVAP